MPILAKKIIFSDEAHFERTNRLTEDTDFRKKKKKSYFQMKLILILAFMSTSKIFTFGSQKTRTHTLKSQRIQNKSLFGTDFSPEGPFFFENDQGDNIVPC